MLVFYFFVFKKKKLKNFLFAYFLLFNALNKTHLGETGCLSNI